MRVKVHKEPQEGERCINVKMEHITLKEQLEERCFSAKNMVTSD